MNTIRKSLIAASLAAFVAVPWALLLVNSASNAQPATATLPAGIVARVGKHTVSAEAVLARINEWEKPLDANRQHLRNAYDYLIKAALLRCEAETYGITVTDDERRKVTDEQIAFYKDKLKQDYGGTYTWEMFLQNQGMSDEQFKAMVYDRSETMILRRRVVTYFEMTNPSVRYVQIRMLSKTDAEKVLDLVNAAKVRAEQPGGKSLLEEFQNIALLQSVDKESLVTAFRSQGVPEPVEKQAFETLKPGECSGVLECGKSDFRLIYLDTRNEAFKVPYATLKEQIDRAVAAGSDIDEARLKRWSAVMFNTKKYESEYRIPGELERKPGSPATPEKPGESDG